MGMYRAGSTRIFNIVREQLLRGTPDARVGHFGDLESIDRTVTIPGPFILKEHEVGRAAVERIRSGDVVALGALREPMPSLVSLCSTFSWRPEVALHYTDLAIRNLEQLRGAVLLYTFGDFCSRNPLVVSRLLRDVGVPASLPRAAVLSRRWSRERMVRLSDADTMPETPGTDLRFDPVTLVHSGHVGSPKSVSDDDVDELRSGAERLQFEERVQDLLGMVR
jgi:hypothetical protein